jgi:hypothetical protein
MTDTADRPEPVNPFAGDWLDPDALRAVLAAAVEALDPDDRAMRELALEHGAAEPGIRALGAVHEPPAGALCLTPVEGVPEALAGEPWLAFVWADRPLCHVHPSAIVRR